MNLIGHNAAGARSSWGSGFFAEPLVLHVDFLEIFDDKPITILVPVKLKGSAQGVLKGGRLIKKARKLKIRALMKDLPDEIVIDITKLDIGDSIKVSDLHREHIEFLDVPRNVVVGVRSARTVVEAVEEAEEGAEEGEGGEETAAEPQEKKEE